MWFWSITRFVTLKELFCLRWTRESFQVVMPKFSFFVLAVLIGLHSVALDLIESFLYR